MKVGNFFVFGFHGYQLPRWVIDFEKRFGLGGVIFFDYYCQTKKYENNIESPEQVRKLCASVHALASRPLIFVDQEGGKVRRLKQEKGFVPYPSQTQYNKLTRSEKESASRASFHELKELGFDYNLAPVIDINFNPENSDIGKVERSYSSKSEDIRENVGIVAAAAQEAGLKLCLKHYPGVGGSKQNAHHELTDLSDSLTAEQEELFYELAPKIPGKTVLVSHGIIRQWEPGTPMTMSQVGLGRLRARVPDALLISDDMQMQGLQLKYGSKEGSLLGLRAGLDLVLIGNNMLNQEAESVGYAEHVANAAEHDGAFRARLLEAEKRIQSRKS